jgi:hypothetical protein
MRISTWFAAGLAGLLLFAVPNDSVAQRRGGTPSPRLPAFTLEAYTGFSTFSRFIEQDVLPNGDMLPPIGERSLNANVAFVLGGALGAWIWDGTGVRLGYTWATTEFKYRDSSGLDRDLLDSGGLNDLNAHIISLEITQLLLSPRKRISPYLLAGINGEFWVLGDQEEADAIRTTTGSQFRWGKSAGVGLQFRASRPLAIRLEADGFSLGSPFRGKSAFIPESGLTFDKPDDIVMPRYTLGLIYTFLRHR